MPFAHLLLSCCIAALLPTLGCANEWFDEWPEAFRLLIDGEDVSLPGHEVLVLGDSSIARVVGDDLFVELLWYGYNNQSQAGFELRVGLQLRGAGTEDRKLSLLGSGVEVLGIDYVDRADFRRARQYPNDPPVTGKVRVEHFLGRTRLSLALMATPTSLATEPMGPTLIELEDVVELEPEARVVYGGTCAAQTSAIYVPLQAGYELGRSYWDRLERDCDRPATAGCYVGATGVCADANRWVCMRCFGDVCVDAEWVSGCYPSGG